MDNTLPARARLDFSQWLMVLSGILMVVVPWWFGLLWLVGAIR